MFQTRRLKRITQTVVIVAYAECINAMHHT